MKREKLLSLLFVFTMLISGCANGNSDSNDSNPSPENSISEVSNNSSTSGSDHSNDSSSSVSDQTSESPISSSENSTTSETSSSGTTNPYYSSINNAEYGETLKKSLRTLITTTHKVETTYSGLRQVFSKSDADPAKSGNIIWFYSGTSVKFSGFGGSNGATNREHVWPKASGKAFPSESKAGSDAHHLRPTETQLNSIRGNKSFGVVKQTANNIAKQNGSTSYASGDYLSYVDGTYFYPGKGFRGQTARILFYVQVRWGAAYNLRFVLGSGSVKTIGDIETLMKWHLEEPVSETEVYRNEAIFKIQGNRNPFIDVPDYACKIYASDGENYNSKVSNVCAAK